MDVLCVIMVKVSGKFDLEWVVFFGFIIEIIRDMFGEVFLFKKVVFYKLVKDDLFVWNFLL